MHCRFCGETISDDSVFCVKCGCDLRDNMEPQVAVDDVVVPPDLKQGQATAEKLMRIGLIMGAVGVAIFGCIVAVGLIVYKKVYLFGGFDFTKILAGVSIALMFLGLCAIFMLFRNGKLPAAMAKKVSLICLAVICVGFSAWGVGDAITNVDANNQGNNSYSPSYTSGSYGENYGKLTESQVISKVKSSSAVQNAIADLYDLKFYYRLDWGTIEVDEHPYKDGYWLVYVRGNVSGYKDAYKTDFVYDKKFYVRVEVSSYGYVTVLGASKN